MEQSWGLLKERCRFLSMRVKQKKKEEEKEEEEEDEERKVKILREEKPLLCRA